MAVDCRLEVLWRAGQERLEVTLSNVGESNHFLACLNHSITIHVVQQQQLTGMGTDGTVLLEAFGFNREI